MTRSVTPATLVDVDVLVALVAEIEAHYGATRTEPADEAARRVADLLFGDRPVAHVLLARVDGQVVGMASYSYLWPAAGTTRSAYLKELYVRAGSRRSGVGRELIRHVTDAARAVGCSRVEWTTDRSSVGAQQFYAALGVPTNPDKVSYRLEVAAGAAALTEGS